MLINRTITIFISLVLIFAGVLLSQPIAVSAGECSSLELLKDGKIVSKDGKAIVAAKASGNYQIKASITKAQWEVCKNTHVRLALIYIDTTNKTAPVNYVIPETQITNNTFSKSISFSTSEKAGIYGYSLELYNSGESSRSSETLRITLGDAGKADVGQGGTQQNPNTDYKAPAAREYDGRGWEGSLEILNPVGSGNGEVKDISQLGTKIINWLLLILGLVATAMIVYAGILLVFNAGNESRVKQAKQTLTWAIIGLVVSLCAFAIVNIIVNLV